MLTRHFSTFRNGGGTANKEEEEEKTRYRGIEPTSHLASANLSYCACVVSSSTRSEKDGNKNLPVVTINQQKEGKKTKEGWI